MATQKPEVGACYKLWSDVELYPHNVIKVLSVEKTFATYYSLGEGSRFIQRWDFVTFPECLNNKLSLLEMELL